MVCHAGQVRLVPICDIRLQVAQKKKPPEGGSQFKFDGGSGRHQTLASTSDDNP
jgi:hypothetical protein